MERLGLWLTTVDSAVMYDAAESQRAVQFLQTHGFKRAGVPLQTGGQVLWPVRAQNNRLGLPLDPRLPQPRGFRDGRLYQPDGPGQRRRLAHATHQNLLSGLDLQHETFGKIGAQFQFIVADDREHRL